ncbi:MAG: bifunctional riboflavin kinase/FAD synthetase [Desulfovibrio sp.]|nr:bifunctional riboflavin kinase/FAD synthetase [Desulfovibrio sp.]
MHIFHSIDELGTLRGCVLTIGNFDGVHVGHQALIRRTLEISRQKTLVPLVMTFWPHPRQVLSPQRGHCPLTSREDRFALLEALGVSHVLELPFTAQLAAMEAASFVRDMLAPLALRHLVVGYDFTLGRNRKGTAAVLTELGTLLGFAVDQLDPVPVDGMVVSSTTLRKLIAEGDVAKAATLLGRWHGFSGEVLHGDGRGAGLGFPTANQRKPDVVLPAVGVYATWATIDAETVPGVTSIGHKPTFGGTSLGVETFLLQGGRNIYGRNLRLEFVDRLRREQNFASVEDLKQQIAADVREARSILHGTARGSGVGR